MSILLELKYIRIIKTLKDYNKCGEYSLIASKESVNQNLKEFYKIWKSHSFNLDCTPPPPPPPPPPRSGSYSLEV